MTKRLPENNREYDDRPRCSWAGTDPLYCRYHDEEWGDPVHDDKKLFEMLILEGFQAGLSWITILRKREHFREAFSEWDWERVARYDSREAERLLANPGIIRNKLKIRAAINNAQRFMEIRKVFGSFDTYVWGFTGNKQLRPKKRARCWEELPTHSPESDALSKDLKARGFKFVGTVIVYSHMQATGMVDDHMEHCWKARKK